MNCMNQFAMYNFNYCVKLVGADSYLATRIWCYHDLYDGTAHI